MADSVRAHAADTFAEARAALGRSRALADARRVLSDLERQLAEPMRVALVGRISSGKSTLANALLGGEVTATGVEELTFNVSWLRYADRPSLTVRFKDGRSEARDFAGLRALTVRNQADRELLAGIDYLTVGLPNPALRFYDLIDTPGLDSHLQADSENTLRLLRRSSADVQASTVTHAARADAVVLVFCRGLAAGEEELIGDFQHVGLSNATPLTAIGALTKVELLWPEHPEPLVEGRRVAERFMNVAGARRLLYDLRPVASKVDFAAATFTEPEFHDLVALAQVDPATLQRKLKLGPFFREREYPELPVTALRRAVLFDRFSGYGVHLACSLIRDGVPDAAALRTELAARSGLAEFRALLTNHFGNRADLIKLRNTIDQVHLLPGRLGPTLTPRDRHTLDIVAAEFRNLDLNEHGFDELRVIRQHYRGELAFSPAQVEELLRITGEHGTDPASRLGLAPGTGHDDLVSAAQQRREHWAGVAVDPTYGGPTRRAAKILHRSYELLLLRLRGLG